MNIVVLGRTEWLYDTCILLKHNGHNIVQIITTKARPEYKKNEDNFKQLAGLFGCQYSNDINDAVEADIAISINWVTLIKKEIIDKYKFGILNAHVGDLPKYRGNATVAWAILNNEERIALTIHKMDEGLDTGNFLNKEYLYLNNNTYIEDVFNWLDIAIPNLFLKTINGNLIETVQDERMASRCYPRMPEDGRINWNDSAEKIYRLIRASGKPYAGAYAYLNDEKIIIEKAHIKEFEMPSYYIPGQVISLTDGIEVATGDGVLVIDQIFKNKITLRSRLR